MEGHNNNNHRNKKNLAIKTQDLLLPQKDEQETIFNPRDETRMLTMEGKNEEEVLQIMTERINMLSLRKEESRRASYKSTRLFMVKMTFQKVKKEYEKKSIPIKFKSSLYKFFPFPQPNSTIVSYLLNESKNDLLFVITKLGFLFFKNSIKAFN